MIGARFTMDADAALKGCEALKKHLPRTVFTALRVYLLRFVRWAILNRFSGPGGDTDTLKRQTGNAIRSIAASPAVEMSETVVRGVAGARPVYVKKHEEGGTFTEYVPAHWRKRALASRRAQRVRNRRRGRTSVVEKLQTHVRVRAHTRRAVYRARRMFRHTLAATRPLGRGIMRQAVITLLRKRRPPTAADLERINLGLFGE